MLRLVPLTVNTLPPARGPKVGSTLTTVAILNANGEDMAETVPLLLRSWTTTGYLPTTVIPVSQRTCLLKIYFRLSRLQATPLIEMLLGERKSFKETPRSVPVIVMIVPPWGGPDIGEILVMAWVGQSRLLIRNGKEVMHASEIVHWWLVPSHQPQKRSSLVLTQEEQSIANIRQSNRVTKVE